MPNEASDRLTAPPRPDPPRQRVDRFRAPVAAAYDAVVAGAGMGGLVTAALLCRAGKHVLVLDGHYVAGGNATVFRRNQFEFDVGVHYLGDCGPQGAIPKILRACGAGGVRFRPMAAELEHMSFPDFDFVIPRDKQGFRTRLLERFPAEARGIDRYLRFLEQVDRVQAAQMSGSTWRQLGALLRSPMVLRYATKSLGAVLDSCTGNLQLRAVLTAQNGTYAVAPGRVSAILHAAIQNHYFVDGGWYPEGGGQVMADHLAAAIEAAGGHIRLRAPVTRIHVEGNRVTGVTFDNKHIGVTRVQAPVVVSNADLKKTVFELVGAEHFPKGFCDRIAGFEMALPLFVVYLGLDIPPSALPYGNSNRWVAGGYDFDEEYALASRGEMAECPTVYLATASLKDPTNRRLAPEGHTNLQVMTAVPADPTFWGVTAEEIARGTYQANEGYRYVKEQVTARVLAQAEKAVPGLSRHIVFKEAATPMTHTRFTGSTGGTSYGIAAIPEQFLNKRPGASTPIEGLFLAGASARSGHGIIGSMLSGVFAADRVLRDGTLARVLRG